MNKRISIRPGLTRVKNLDNDKLGTVADNLSVQITVDYDDGTFNFCMKSDYGYGWKIIEEDPDDETDPVPDILEQSRAKKLS